MLGRALRIDANDPEKIAYFMLPYYVDETEDPVEDEKFFVHDRSTTENSAKRQKRFSWQGSTKTGEQIEALNKWFSLRLNKATNESKTVDLINELSTCTGKANKINEMASQEGFDVVHFERDGNAQFSAIAEQLEGEETHTTVREKGSTDVAGMAREWQAAN